MRCWLCCFVMLVLAGCSKNDPTKNNGVENGNALQISLSSVVKDQPLVLKDSSYLNAAGESFTVTTFKYYLSNFSLLTADNKTIALPNTYFLVDESDSTSKKFSLSGIPDGSYKSVTFMVGVDSTRNVSGAQTGALDVIHGMFWTWRSGYIMGKLEGISPVSKNVGNILQYHIGGFESPYNAIRSVTMALAQPQVWSGGLHSISMKADVYAWFNVPNQISFATFPGTMEPGANAMKIADNYAQMFTITSITTP